MRLIVFVTFFIPLVSIKGQQSKIHKIFYEDTTYMALNNAEHNSWYVKRNKIKDLGWNGKMIIFYNKALTDTAIKVNLLDGIYEGLYKEWDRKDKYISHECFYENGFRQDTCYNYVYLFPEYTDGVHKDSILIEIYGFKCYKENGIDVVGEEWVKYKTIHRSEYEKATGIVRKKIEKVVENKEYKSDKDTIIKFESEISKGYIKIKIKGKKGDDIYFGYYDGQGNPIILSKSTITFNNEINKESWFDISKGNGYLFIKLPSDNQVTYTFSTTKTM